jgi:hypothetical protein
MSRINEQDEMLLNRLLDGDLSADDAAALRQRIQREPALRNVWERLSRIDGLLRERRTDTCQLDWGRFHASVVNQIGTDAVPVARVIRFPLWTRVAAPLAAAAAVALVLILRAPHEPGKPAGTEPGVIRVAYHTPQPAAISASGAIVVRFHRPGGSMPQKDSAAPIHVAFSRSSQLEEQIRAADTARESNASSHLYIMHADGRSPAIEAAADLPPL